MGRQSVNLQRPFHSATKFTRLGLDTSVITKIYVRRRNRLPQNVRLLAKIRVENPMSLFEKCKLLTAEKTILPRNRTVLLIE